MEEYLHIYDNLTSSFPYTFTSDNFAIKVTGVTLNKNTTSITKSATEKLIATVAPSDATNPAVTWSSSDEAVATVATDGTVTAVDFGTATITVKTTDGNFTDTCTVTVPVPVSGVSLDQSSLSFTVGDPTVTLVATVAPPSATNKAVTWSSSAEGVATVSATGVVTAIAAGSAVITVKTTDGNFTDTCTVTVSAATSATISITFAIDDVTPSITVPTLYKTSATPHDQALTLTNASAYDTISWFMDGNAVAVATGATYTVDATTLSVGPHTITVVGYIGAAPHNMTVLFRVEQ